MLPREFDRRGWLAPEQFTVAYGLARITPGPNMLAFCAGAAYVVGVGYYAARLPGAWVGWLGMVTPAFPIVPMLPFIGKRAKHPRVKSAIRMMLLASSGLLLYLAVPLARGAVTGPVSLAIPIASFLALAI